VTNEPSSRTRVPVSGCMTRVLPPENALLPLNGDG
jgi:hypothetical protein